MLMPKKIETKFEQLSLFSADELNLLLLIDSSITADEYKKLVNGKKSVELSNVRRARKKI